MNLYYELLQYPVFSMKEVNALYSSERTARAALGKLLKENIDQASELKTELIKMHDNSQNPEWVALIDRLEIVEVKGEGEGKE